MGYYVHSNIVIKFSPAIQDFIKHIQVEVGSNLYINKGLAAAVVMYSSEVLQSSVQH